MIACQSAACFRGRLVGLHALQHRGQEAGGIVTHDPVAGFNSARRFGYVRDNFTSASVMETLPGPSASAMCAIPPPAPRAIRRSATCSPSFGEFAMGGAAIAHNGNITNAAQLRRELIERGSIFQSSSDSECIIHLMARSIQRTIPERMKDALRRVEGAFSIVAMTRTKLIGVRDPLGVRPLVLGRLGDGWVLASETCALDIIGADSCARSRRAKWWSSRRVGVESYRPFEPRSPRFCIFEHVYFSRPDSILGGRSVYETRRAIGAELAREAPARPIWSARSPIQRHACGDRLARNRASLRHGDHPQPVHGPHLHRTHRADPQHGRAAEAQRQPRAGRGQAGGAGRRQRGARHDQPQDQGNDPRCRRGRGAFPHRLPPTAWPCFYGVDTPAARKAAGRDDVRGRDARSRRHLDGGRFACFSGDYPVHLARRALPRRGRGR
jgi:amidophosphoribosyltransferase